MRLLFVLVLATTAVLTPRAAEARQSDAIKATLDKARSAHGARIEAARTKLEKAIEAKIEEVAAKADLASLKKLEAVKNAFVQDRTLPTEALVAKARKDYDTEIFAANLALRKARETAKLDYTKARKIAEAEAVDAELRASAPKVARPQVKEPPPNDKITGQWSIAIGDRTLEGEKVRTMNIRIDAGGGASVPGMLWRKDGADVYTLIFPGGRTAKVRLGARGEQFRGKMTDGKPVIGNRKV